MVSIEVINKSISEAIKSHQHLTLNSKVKTTFNNFAKETRHRKKEKAILTNDNGEILRSKNGTEHNVDVGALLLLTFLDDNHKKPIHVDHNHPNSKHSLFPTQLSDNDINRLMDTCKQTGEHFGEYLVKSVTCEDSYNHSRMTLVRGDKFDKERDGEKFERGKFYLYNEGLFKHVTKFRENFEKEFEALWSKVKDKPKTDAKEYYELQREITFKASDKALKDTGYYDDLHKLQKVFREANCKLIFEWVDDN